jgi:AcrR family transcriptional regulator
MSKNTGNRPSLTAQDWVDAASEILGDGGIDAVRVEPLARRLKVTKGSFYWHFSNRSELLEAVLNGWRKRATSEIIQRINASKLPAKERLKELFLLPKHGTHALQGANLEIAIRQWAKHEDLARSAVDEVDQHRLSFIKGIYVELGYNDKDSVTKALLFYCTMQGMANIPHLITEDIVENGKRILEEEQKAD